MGWIILVLLILILAGDLTFRLFWLRPRYDRFVVKYGTDPTFSLALWLCWGAWYHYALSSRRAWRNIIIMNCLAEAFIVILLALIWVSSVR